MNSPLSLILEMDDFSIEAFCIKARAFQNLPVEIIRGMNAEDISRIEYSRDIPESHALKPLLERLKDLNATGLLPRLSGFVGLGSILESSDFSDEDYIGTHDWGEEGKIKGCRFINGEYVEADLSTNKLNVVSSLQESECIIGSTENPGEYYIMYHDMGEPEPLAGSHDDFIKAMIAMSLLNNKDAFSQFMSKETKKNDLVDFNSFEALLRMVLVSDMMVSSITGNYDEELSEKYWGWRET